MFKQLLGISMLFIYFSFITGCASKLPLRDDSGQPIPPKAIQAKKSNSNFVLYAIGGGALSFGASFFLGSLVDRAADNENNTALWLTAGIGTAIGIAYFAHAGKTRDHNLAVLAAREDRKTNIAQKLTTEKEKRQKIEEEKRQLLMEREKQEAERKKILEKLKKKKKN
ncbi:MAG: hypothetical protein ACE5I1_21375 [bacterium]